MSNNKAMFTSPEDVYVNSEGKAVDRKSTDRFMKIVAAGQAIPLEDAVKAGIATGSGTFLTPNIPDEDREERQTLIATDTELGKGPKASDSTKLGKAEKEIETLKADAEKAKADSEEALKTKDDEIKKLNDENNLLKKEIETLKADAEKAKAQSPDKDKAVDPAANKAVTGPPATK